MPRERKQKLKKRPDGRYACRYHGQWFYSYDPDDCLMQRDEFKQAETHGKIMRYFVSEYVNQWLPRAHPNVAPSTMNGLKMHVNKLCNVIGNLPVSDVKPSDLKEVYSTQYAGLSNSSPSIECLSAEAATANSMVCCAS